MTLNEVKKENIIVTQINREYPVLICRDRVTSLYRFFKVHNNQYLNVDEQMQKHLESIFKTTPKTTFYLNQQDGQVSEKELCEEFTLAKQLILSALCDLPSDVQKKCKEKLDTVTLILNSNANVDSGVTMYYNRHEHQITVVKSFENKYQRLCALIHECLHAASSNAQIDSVGFSTVVNNTNNGCKRLAALGTGINEAATDFYAYEIMKKHILKNKIKNYDSQSFLAKTSISGYDQLCNAYYNLTKNIDDDLCLEFYIKSNLDGFIKYLSQYYHYFDNDNVLSLIYKLDLFVDLISSQHKQSVDDMLSIMFDINRNILDLNKHKLLIEGNQLNAEDFKFLFSEYRLSFNSSDKIKFISDFKKYYLSKIQSNLDVVHNHNLISDINFISFIFYSFELNKPIKIPSEFYHSDLFFKMFSKHYAEDKIKKRKCFKWLFSSETNAFIDKDHKLKTLYDILSVGYLLDFKPIPQVEVCDLAELINRVPSFATTLSNLDDYVIRDCLPFLNRDILNNKHIVNAIYHNCVQIKEESGIMALLCFYRCLFKNEKLATETVNLIVKNLKKSNILHDAPQK